MVELPRWAGTPAGELISACPGEVSYRFADKDMRQG
jgi:hypothetical protein